MNRARKSTGRIVFIGSGPGDPELLTTRAVGALTEADVVFVDPDVPELVRATLTGDVRAAALAGDTIRTILAEARTGASVARLVAGDPMSSDAVIKEVLATARTVVPFEVVPGVGTGIGAASHAGIPVGSLRTAVDRPDVAAIDFDSLAAAPGTLLLTLAAHDVARVGEQLVANGVKPDTPVAVICEGTTTRQQTVVGTLGDLGLAVAGMSGPVVVTIGKVVAQREKLGWWESRPLYGWQVLVPRTKEQAGDMSKRLRAYGAVPVEVATIAVEPPRTPTQMERAIKGLVTGRYEWIVFTSTNAVRAVWEKFAEFGLDARAFAGVKIACVGESTAAAVRSLGIVAELVPTEEQSSEGLLAVFPDYDDVLDPIDRVLLPRADIATETLSAGLRERGWAIDDVTAYRTVRAAPPEAKIRDAIKSGGFQAVCFTSSSTVRNLVGIAGKPHAKTVVAAIGPATAATAAEFGLRVDVQAEAPTVAGLVDALAEFALRRSEEDREKAAEAAAKKAARPPTRRAAR
ncbi:MAG: uroporphyrinogen-III synthase [Actinomycetota bacterium]|nr:uroporphyrinogen-III synthase [Actinomycetota bacterium]